MGNQDHPVDSGHDECCGELRLSGGKANDADAKCRGVIFTTNLRYITKHCDFEKIKEIQTVYDSKNNGVHLDRIKLTGWYSLDSRIDLLHSICEVLGWGNDEVVEMGRFASQSSTIMGYYLRHLIDIKTAVKSAPVYWQKHYSSGTMVVGEIGDDLATICLKDFQGDPLLCSYLQGYYKGVGEMAHNGPGSVDISENECVFNGGQCHVYTLKW